MKRESKKKIWWTGGVALAGFIVSLKGTYGEWEDVRQIVPVTIAGAVIGFLFGCIVIQPRTRRDKVRKLIYWLAIGAILGCAIALGGDLDWTRQWKVILSFLGVFLFFGWLQFWLQKYRAAGGEAAIKRPFS